MKFVITICMLLTATAFNNVYADNERMSVKTDGGITVSTPDGRFSFDLGGRLMIDAAFYDEDKNPLGDGTEFRRARLELGGTLFKDWGFDFDVDFSAGRGDVKEAAIFYKGFKPAKITIGHTIEPFSLEGLTSSKHITFMERALNNVFLSGRSIGINTQTSGQNWNAAAGIFGESFKADASNEGNEGWSTTARFTYAPILSDTRSMHLGIAGSYRTPNSDKQLRIRARPESHITGMRYVDTGTITNVTHSGVYGLEVASVFDAFSLQGEYIRTDINRGDELSEVTFNGWYVYGSWFLTGESRPYNAKKGSFGRIKPKNKGGAWEFAARYSVLELNDGPITGGQEENITVGINWYLNKQTRLLLNYIIVDNDQDANAKGDAVGDDDPNILQMRFQVDF
ncbi:MAG: porin [Pseudomonadota bacterium]